jgi:hypothetical protein
MTLIYLSVYMQLWLLLTLLCIVKMPQSFSLISCLHVLADHQVGCTI